MAVRDGIGVAVGVSDTFILLLPCVSFAFTELFDVNCAKPKQINRKSKAVIKIRLLVISHLETLFVFYVLIIVEYL
jgi:hypothetical protein